MKQDENDRSINGLKMTADILSQDQSLEGYFRDPGFDRNTVRDSGKRKIF